MFYNHSIMIIKKYYRRNMIKKLTTDVLCFKLSKIAGCDKDIFMSDSMMMGFDELMTIEELAQYLRVKKRTIYEWLKKGKIPAIKTVGQWRFRRDKINAWLETHNR